MIKIKNLSFSYKKRNPIYNNVSFEIKSGIYGLLGENGVGKTTLLHLISGLRSPDSGTCEVMGYNSAYRNPNMLSKLFFLPEEFDTPSLNISTFTKLNAPFYPRFSHEQFNEYLKTFQVDKTRKMTELSLGQKKKAMIAFALATNTQVLLLDEPSNGLDIPSKSQFRRIISSLVEDNRCIIISTHQVRDIEHLIDPIIILDHNQVLINNSVQEITEKLYFSYTNTKPEDTLYCEQYIQGYLSVRENHYNEDSSINIEALFSAVVNNKVKIKEIFNHK